MLTFLIVINASIGKVHNSFFTVKRSFYLCIVKQEHSWAVLCVSKIRTLRCWTLWHIWNLKKTHIFGNLRFKSGPALYHILSGFILKINNNGQLSNVFHKSYSVHSNRNYTVVYCIWTFFHITWCCLIDYDKKLVYYRQLFVLSS